jgi:hypothetical protein
MARFAVSWLAALAVGELRSTHTPSRSAAARPEVVIADRAA